MKTFTPASPNKFIVVHWEYEEKRKYLFFPSERFCVAALPYCLVISNPAILAALYSVHFTESSMIISSRQSTEMLVVASSFRVCRARSILFVRSPHGVAEAFHDWGDQSPMLQRAVNPACIGSQRRT